MQTFDGVNVNKLNGGLGRTNPSDDNIGILAYVIPSADLPVGAVHYIPHLCSQLSDVETLGYNAAFDANKVVLLHHAASEFFRKCPDGKIWVMPVPALMTPTAIATHASFLAGVRTASTGNGIVIGNLAYTSVQMTTYAEGVQGMVNTLAAEHRLIDYVVLAGKGEASPTLIASYPDLRTKNAPNISVSIAQDGGIADIAAGYALYADIGAVLAMICVRKVNENLGSVDIVQKPDANKADPDYPLNFDTLWAEPRLSDGTKLTALTLTDQTTLTTKGYIFAGSYPGYGGVFFNSSPTAVEAASDYAYIEYNRTWNKAARLIRTTLMPKVKGNIKKDPVTGYIKSTTITQWTNLAKKALERMFKADEISGYDVYINPKQIVNDTTPLAIKAEVVVDDIAHGISVDLGLKNKL